MTEKTRVILVKFGGSLITDKTGPERVHQEIVATLARELVAFREATGAAVFLGHGSGSFGHLAARSTGWTRGGGPPTKQAMATTQDAAARLHRIVVGHLLGAGARPISIVPGSLMTCHSGRVDSISVEPLVRSFQSGLLPVTFGDVVMDDQDGAAIVSTESVFEAVVPELIARGILVTAVVWLGNTAGLLDGDGQTMPEIRGPNVEEARGVAGGADADVTGGMRLRLEATIGLSGLGIPSWIVDGNEPGILGRVAGSLMPDPGGSLESGTYVTPGIF